MSFLCLEPTREIPVWQWLDPGYLSNLIFYGYFLFIYIDPLTALTYAEHAPTSGPLHLLVPGFLL